MIAIGFIVSLWWTCSIISLVIILGYSLEKDKPSIGIPAVIMIIILSVTIIPFSVEMNEVIIIPKERMK